MFGVEPYLPMDRFSVGTDEAAITHHQWVRKTQQKPWKAAKNIKQYNDGNRRRQQEQAIGESLQEGQWVLLGNHSVVGRNKVYPKFAEEVWVIVEVLDKVSGVYWVRPEDEQGYEKVLHRSNLRPLRAGYCEGSSEQQQQDKGPQHVEDRQISEEDEEGKQVEEEELEMPDMTEMLRRFGFDDGSPSRVEENGNNLTTIPEC